jgi:hypothetical protein
VGDSGSICELVGPDGHLLITVLFRDNLTTIFKYLGNFFFILGYFFLLFDQQFHHVGVEENIIVGLCRPKCAKFSPQADHLFLNKKDEIMLVWSKFGRI